MDKIAQLERLVKIAEVCGLEGLDKEAEVLDSYIEQEYKTAQVAQQVAQVLNQYQVKPIELTQMANTAVQANKTFLAGLDSILRTLTVLQNNSRNNQAVQNYLIKLNGDLGNYINYVKAVQGNYAGIQSRISAIIGSMVQSQTQKLNPYNSNISATNTNTQQLLAQMYKTYPNVAPDTINEVAQATNYNMLMLHNILKTISGRKGS